MKRLLCLPLLALITLLAILQIPALASEKYHMVLIPNPSEQTILAMAELGLPLDDAHQIKGQGLEIPLSESDIALLQNRGIPYQIVRPDLEKYYGEIGLDNLKHVPPQVDTDPVHMKYGSMGGFYTWEQINADLDSMNLLYPGICAPKVSIGQGWNANPLYMVKISDNPGAQEDEPEAEFDATSHAREPGSNATLMYAMWWLLENYGTNPEATYLVNNRQLYFIPVFNPDGFRYNQQTNPNGGGMWRKNRRFNNPSYGVDNNRNFTYKWGNDNYGSSPTPSSETYRGPSAGSEPETQAVMNFIIAHNIKVSNNLHTYTGVYLCPYGWSTELPPLADYNAFMEYMTVCTAASGYNFGPINSPLMYVVNGGSIDWEYHDRNSMAMTVEVGTVSFWPPINYIMPDAAVNLPGLLYQFWVAGARLEGTDLNVADGYLTPGQNENLIATVMNRGQSTSEPFTYELTTTSPYVTLTPNVVSVESLIKRTSTSNSGNPFVAQVAGNCPVGHSAVFNLVIHQGTYTRTKAYTLIVGTPTAFFSDNAENGMGNWTATGGWGLATNNYHSPTRSFADSPTGNYGSNTTRYLTLTGNVNLSTVNVPWLDFWTRWELEGGWDFAQVEVSTNGTTWTAIPGNYTNLGTGQGVQPNGQPGYDGSQYDWVHEHMNLASYSGQANFKFRFKLRSDAGFNLDGWYVDDIQVLGFTGGPSYPNVALDLVYTSGSPVPPTGGPLAYTLQITNNESASQPFQYWSTYSQGSTVVPAFGPASRTAPPGPGYIITRYLTQMVPASLGAGAWNYNGYLGSYPSTVWATDAFPFTKLVTGDGGAYISEGTLTGWEEEEVGLNSVVPMSFELEGNFPNPFNPTTMITYQLPTDGFVSLQVYDTAGRLVAELVNGWREAGAQEVIWDASNNPSGIYFYRLEAGGFADVKKMVLVK